MGKLQESKSLILPSHAGVCCSLYRHGPRFLQAYLQVVARSVDRVFGAVDLLLEEGKQQLLTAPSHRRRWRRARRIRERGRVGAEGGVDIIDLQEAVEKVHGLQQFELVQAQQVCTVKANIGACMPSALGCYTKGVMHARLLCSSLR